MSSERSERGPFRVRASLLVVTLAALLWPALAAAATPQEYRQVLGETLAAAEQVMGQPELKSLADSPQLAGAMERLAAIEAVDLPDGTRITVDNKELLALLRGRREVGERAVTTLRALVATVDAAETQRGSPERAEALGKLDEVLARREFRSTPNPVAQFMDDLRQRLFHWLKGLIPGLHSPVWEGTAVGQALLRAVEVLLWALAVFALAFFLFWWWNARQNLARYAALRGQRPQVEPDDAGAARLAAEQAAASGDYRGAVHFLYLWAMLHLAAQARLSYDRALTNHEQLRALPRDSALAARLRPVVDAFDRLWYGYAACGKDEYGQFRGAVEQLVEATA